MQIVLNKCFGGFHLSNEACEWLINNKGYKLGEWLNGNFPKGVHLVKAAESFIGYHINESLIAGVKGEIFDDDVRFRSHPDIIEVVKALGSTKASGRCSKLEIVTIPEGIEGKIEEYDGMETFEELHRSF